MILKNLTVGLKLGQLGFRRSFQTFVSAHWLNDLLEEGKGSKLRIVHSSWSEDAEDYYSAHIPNAVCFKGTECRDNESPYRNMMPSADLFQETVRSLGVGKNSHVVVYDTNESTPSLETAARVWFMFRAFNHQRVSILDGGLYNWTRQGLPTSREETNVDFKGDFDAVLNPKMIKSFEEVMENLSSKKLQILDARSPPRFAGEEETYGQAGHIRGSLNLPLKALLDPNSLCIKSEEELKATIEEIGVKDPNKILASCGSGMTACAIIAAMHTLGHKSVPLYDGSWFEFNRRASAEFFEKGRH